MVSVKRILVADDNAAIRRGIAILISGLKDFEVCGEAADGNDTVRKARELRPDLVLLDISMPGGNGLEIAGTLRKDNPEMKILIISQHDVARLLPASRDAGASGCVDKARVGIDLLPAIQTIFKS